MNLREFKKLSLNEQAKIIKQITNKYLVDLKNQERISKELNIVQSAVRKIIEENNIKRTKEQIFLARKKYSIEKYVNENYCNSKNIS